VRAFGAEPVDWVRAPQRPDASPTSYVIKDWDARTPLGAFSAARDGLMVGPAAEFAADTSTSSPAAPPTSW
jgi:hypothetical protein